MLIAWPLSNRDGLAHCRTYHGCGYESSEKFQGGLAFPSRRLIQLALTTIQKAEMYCRADSTWMFRCPKSHLGNGALSILLAAV
jgi:hypothetical protein